MSNSYLRVFLTGMILLGLSACKRPADDPVEKDIDEGHAGAPPGIAKAKVVTGRVICPLEIVNGASIRESRSFPAGSKATLVGWSRVADQEQPTPPLVHVVFRSTVPDGSPDHFWPGTRVARPELAQNDPRLARLGYAASGTFPTNPGKYEVLVWVGDESQQRECDTGEVFSLQG